MQRYDIFMDNATLLLFPNVL